MEALTISAANLNVIEESLGTVAKELSGVINNVGDVNRQVNKVEAQVADLNDEIKGLVKEIRETTIVTNARQNIMFNNEQIEKKFGYFDKVRRTTEALLEAIDNSTISVNDLKKLNQELLFHNPNYWLSNALSSITYWILDDKENSEKEMLNALKKDSKRSSIFFCLINLKFNRINTSINWLNKYLKQQNPIRLDKDFLTILDLVANGEFGNEAKNIVLNKISSWFIKLNSEKELQEKQVKIWEKFLLDIQDNDITLPNLEIYAENPNILKKNLALSSIHPNALYYFENIRTNEYSPKTASDVLSNLIYDYETKEQVYQKENFKNRLIIECNGNKEEAEKIYEKQEAIFNEETDLLTLLSNLVMNNDLYKISNKTQTFALTLVKNYIEKAINNLTNQINKEEFAINIKDFTTKTKDGKNLDEIKNDLDIHLNSLFPIEDKDIIFTLLIMNILGIIGLFITLNNKIISAILIALLILGNILLFSKLNKRTNNINHEKKKTKELYLSVI